jgi:hypothetical protein
MRSTTYKSVCVPRYDAIVADARSAEALGSGFHPKG